MNYAYDYDGNPGFTDNGLYVAYRLLGATPQANDNVYRKRTNYAAWQFRNFSNPSEIFFSPQDDIGRYEVMRSSLSAEGLSVVNRRPGNYIELLSTGPFKAIEPDSSVNVVFALIGAGKFDDEPNNIDSETMRRNLYANASWAQRLRRRRQEPQRRLDREKTSFQTAGSIVLSCPHRLRRRACASLRRIKKSLCIGIGSRKNPAI
jgi:hypothetical protein